MITLDGNEFRSLSHPIFINNQAVQAVYLGDGRKVYPDIASEITSGTFIKIRGNISFYYHGFYPAYTYHEYVDSAKYDDCDFVWNFSASFAEIMECVVPGYSIKYIGSRYREPYCYRPQLDISDFNSNKLSGSAYMYLDEPDKPDEYLIEKTPSLIKSHLIYFPYPSGSVIAKSRILKVNFAPIPLSSYQEAHGSYGSPLTGYRWRLTGYPVDSVCQWNNIIHQFTSERCAFNYSERFYSPTSKYSLRNYLERSGSEFYPYTTVDELELSTYNFNSSEDTGGTPFRADVTDIYKSGEEFPSIIGMESERFNITCSIPITDIVYLGEKNKAPANALKLSKSDLIW